MGSELVFGVAVSGTSFGYDKLYSYKASVELKDKIKVGMRVLVPFGYGNRKRVGLVLSAQTGEAAKLKPVSSLIDEVPLLNEEMLEMVSWLKETAICTYFDALKTIIPIAMGVNFTQKYTLAENPPVHILTDEEQALFDILKAAKNSKEFDALLDYSAVEQKKAVVQSLLSKGLIEEADSVKRRVKDNTVSMLRLSEEYLSGTMSFELSAKQKKVVETLEQNETASVKELCYLCNITAAVTRNLCKKGVLTEYEYEVILSDDVAATKSADDVILSEQQNEVFRGISHMLAENKPQGALLYGITGSGKTSVFIKLIDYTLKCGKTAILLIPQISLTPQTVKKFSDIFGGTIALIHSNLSLSQRLNEYKKITSGQAKIVIGTRSAVFAPLENIGLIIMDEEDERTYKSENAPRYHARDIARKRSATHNAVLLMASATPSIESYFYAESERYKLFEMSERYTNTPLPDVEIIDMGEEMHMGNISNFSDALCSEIQYNLEHGEQTILLLNRRGYHTHISCPKCRETISCPNCNIPLTYHKVNNRMICHYCNYQTPFDEKCPSCGNDKLKMTGVGTQKAEDELSQIFSDARILRMDTDTTYSRYAYENKFKAFANGEYDIMVGTQMIAKGLDFPNVTLVGVISVDKILFAGDFRSYERTFSLITQVVGRSGRGEKRGRAILQTFVPDHYILNLAAKQDYKGFYKEEIALRKALIYPPYCDICVIGFSSLVDAEAESAAGIFLDLMKQGLEEITADFPMRVLGPTKAVYGKINGKYRYRIIIKTKNTPKFREYISLVYEKIFGYKNFSNVSVYVDINGEIGI